MIRPEHQFYIRPDLRKAESAIRPKQLVRSVNVLVIMLISPVSSDTAAYFVWSRGTYIAYAKTSATEKMSRHWIPRNVQCTVYMYSVSQGSFVCWNENYLLHCIKPVIDFSSGLVAHVQWKLIRTSDLPNFFNRIYINFEVFWPVNSKV